MLCRYFGVSFLYILRIRMVSLGYLYLDEVVIQDKNMDKVYEFNSWTMVIKAKERKFLAAYRRHITIAISSVLQQLSYNNNQNNKNMAPTKYLTLFNALSRPRRGPSLIPWMSTLIS